MSTWEGTLVDAVLIDAAVDLYVDWREEAAAVRSAYQRWQDVPARDHALAHASYVAALDREERAAGLYAAALWRLAGRQPDRARPRARTRWGSLTRLRPRRPRSRTQHPNETKGLST
jgi:hypothetical protein